VVVVVVVVVVLVVGSGGVGQKQHVIYPSSPFGPLCQGSKFTYCISPPLQSFIFYFIFSYKGYTMKYNDCVIINMPRPKRSLSGSDYKSKVEKQVNLPKVYAKSPKTEKMQNLPVSYYLNRKKLT
jgi:hypothetical protein